MTEVKNTPVAATAAQPPAITKKRFQEETITDVLNKVNSFTENGQLHLPANYSPANALRAGFLILQETVNKEGKCVLDYCTPASISTALYEMVIKGLNPVKKQCYFVPYGNELSCDSSRFGNEVVAKRVGHVKEFKPYAVYEGDEFEYELNVETGVTKIIKHKQTLDSKDHEKVKGAYVYAIYDDGRIDVEVMSIKQIRTAWNQGASKGGSPAHKNFTDEMACKTVTNRACKKIINSTDDADLFEDDYAEKEDAKSAAVRQEIGNNGNKTLISMSSPAAKPSPAKNYVESETMPEEPVGTSVKKEDASTEPENPPY